MSSKDGKSISSRKWVSSYKKLFPWSNYQTSVFDWIEKSNKYTLLNSVNNEDLFIDLKGQRVSRSLVISSVAGSGKTTTILGIVGALKGSAHIVAFNEHIAKRLKTDSRIPKSRVKVSTAHSLGFYLIRRSYGGQEFKVNNSKYPHIIDYVYKSLGIDFDLIIKNRYPYLNKAIRSKKKYYLKKFLLDIVNKSRLCLIEPEVNNLKAFIEDFGIHNPLPNDDGDILLSYISHVLEVGKDKLITDQEIDFTDMLWIPYINNIDPVTIKDYLIVDEAQDLNPCMISLFYKYYQKGSITIFTGDPNQAINGFMGSDYTCWKRLKEEFNSDTKELNYCYRCPKSHLEMARLLVPNIESPEGTKEGIINIHSVDDINTLVKPKDLVLCRFNAPIVRLCLKLIASNRIGVIRGKQIYNTLVNLINLTTKPNYDLDTSVKALEDYYNNESKILIRDEEYTALEDLTDKYKALSYIYIYINNEVDKSKVNCNIAYIKEFLSNLFNGAHKENAVIFSTFHSSKGDEANNTFIIANRSSFPYLNKAIKPWMEEQEWNLVYVALTRSKHSMTFLYEPNDFGKSIPKLNDLIPWLTLS